jgi:hypothetical protein
MAEAEGFLARWSRLKREAETEAATPVPVPEDEPLSGDAPAEEAEPIEVASLPPLESLCAESDYTAFLKQGVPEELQRLALRKAWSTDPAISAFRGFAEYDWDCNAPGYGALLPADDILRLCRSILGEREEEEEPIPPTEEEAAPPLLAEPAAPELVAAVEPGEVAEPVATPAREAG